MDPSRQATNRSPSRSTRAASFIYVANALDATVSAYVIDLTTGTPSLAVNPTGSGTNTTGTQPVSIAVDPALGRFVYTANLPGQLNLGFPPRSHGGHADHHPGHALPQRVKANRAGHRAPRQPLHTGSDALATASSQKRARPSAGLFSAHRTRDRIGIDARLRFDNSSTNVLLMGFARIYWHRARCGLNRWS